MIHDDENQPRRKVSHEIGADLTTISVEELTARIALLQDEIARLATEIEKKKSSRSTAENFFKL